LPSILAELLVGIVVGLITFLMVEVLKKLKNLLSKNTQQ